MAKRLDLDRLRELSAGTFAFPSAPTPAPAPTPPAPQGGTASLLSAPPAPMPAPLGANRVTASAFQPGQPGTCPDGFYWNGFRCSQIGPDSPPDPDCPAGTHWEFGHCEPDTGAPRDCPGGQTRGENGECGSPDCPDGQGILYPGGPCVGGSGGEPTPQAPTAPTGPSFPRFTAPPVGPPITFSPKVTDFNALLEKMIREGLAAPSRYTPQALQALYGQIARQSSGRIARGEQAVRADAARRGMQRSGFTAAAIQGVRDAAESERGQSIVGVQMAKINADYADKNAALDRAQRYLDSLRDSEYRMLIATEQRRQFDANLALGYASLAQQRSLLELQLKSEKDRLLIQLQSEWDRLRALMGFQFLGQGV